MATGVGLYVGETQSVAVVTTPGAALRTVERATVLTPGPDGGVELGTRSDDSVEGFVSKVGTTEGIRYAGAETRAEDLIATAMFCLFRDLATGLHGDVDVVAAHPCGWSEDATRALRESLDYMGLQHAKLVSAEEAVAVSSESYATDDEADSAVSDSLPGWAAAHGGALIGSGVRLPRNAQPFDTDSFPAVPREEAMAYSQAIVIPASEHFVAADIGTALPVATPAAAQAAPIEKDVPVPARKPLLLAGAVAGILTLAGVAAALAFGYTGSTDAPPIRDVTQADATSTTTRNAPIKFPTVAPHEAAVHDAPVPQSVADPLPAVVEQPVPAAPPVQIPTAVPPAPTTVEPPAPTTETPTETTTTEPTTPPETTTPDDPTDPADPEHPDVPDPADPSKEEGAKGVAVADTLLP